MCKQSADSIQASILLMKNSFKLNFPATNIKYSDFSLGLTKAICTKEHKKASYTLGPTNAQRRAHHNQETCISFNKRNKIMLCGANQPPKE